ncbi:TetR/AcrR family transcriptional regulator [Raoultibacter phocaeensis]|uniref:TetR/AcrR family transcriptional regulator n=1 Tax=Raoultibacter phocaeensis TaxID=2479841 RepID=UPI00111B9C3F|nr:TetR family transcriptional regulator [Raoultibacter phocaeensis]
MDSERDCKSEGLRERKRRQTREAIERAAITLVGERGYAAVTVDDICARVGISQGTFFNYFPTKDAAIVGMGIFSLNDEAVFVALDRYMPATLFHAVLSLFLDIVRGFDWEGDIAKLRIELVKETPELMKLFLNNSFEYVDAFRASVAAYLAQHDELRACTDTLDAADEASAVVSHALEAAKFALYQATKRQGSALMSASEVEAVLRSLLGR